MAIFDFLYTGKKKKLELELKIANARAREAQSKERVINRVAKLSGFSAQAKMTGLQKEVYPSAEKSRNSLLRSPELYNTSNDRLRRISRIAIFESPQAAAQVGRLSEIVIGAGLQLRLQPMWSMIPGAPEIPEERAAWVHFVEERYRMWGKSYRPEYNRRRNLPQLSKTLFDYLLQDGEYFVLLRYSNSMYENPLTLQIIPPENITGGSPTADGNEVSNGIEYDSYGEAVAYFIRDDKTGKTTRIPRFGNKSGRIFMLHNFLSTNEKQRRGVPYLANVIEEFVKIGHYEQLEIQAAIVNALFAAWVKPPDDIDGEPVISTISKADAQIESDTNNYAEKFVSDILGTDISKGGLFIDSVPAGHSVESFDTKRPNVNFGGFVNQVVKSLSASKGMPVSVADLMMNSSYSAARGELLLFWMSVNRWRQNHGYDFEDDVFQMWFTGEVLRGKIQAVGALQDKELLLAYTNAEWTGNQRPDIDPMKSVTAHILEQKQGYKTGEQITAERGGGDYQSNLQVIKQELAEVAQANAPLMGSQQSQP